MCHHQISILETLEEMVLKDEIFLEVSEEIKLWMEMSLLMYVAVELEKMMELMVITAVVSLVKS